MLTGRDVCITVALLSALALTTHASMWMRCPTQFEKRIRAYEHLNPYFLGSVFKTHYQAWKNEYFVEKTTLSRTQYKEKYQTKMTWRYIEKGAHEYAVEELQKKWSVDLCKGQTTSKDDEFWMTNVTELFLKERPSLLHTLEMLQRNRGRYKNYEQRKEMAKYSKDTLLQRLCVMATKTDIWSNHAHQVWFHLYDVAQGMLKVDVFDTSKNDFFRDARNYLATHEKDRRKSEGFARKYNRTNEFGWRADLIYPKRCEDEKDMDALILVIGMILEDANSKKLRTNSRTFEDVFMDEWNPAFEDTLQTINVHASMHEPRSAESEPPLPDVGRLNPVNADAVTEINSNSKQGKIEAAQPAADPDSVGRYCRPENQAETNECFPKAYWYHSAPKFSAALVSGNEDVAETKTNSKQSEIEAAADPSVDPGRMGTALADERAVNAELVESDEDELDDGWVLA